MATFLPFPGRDLPPGTDPSHLLRALRLLAEAHAGLGLPEPGTGVAPDAFARAGVPHGALRWLVSKGLARPVTEPSAPSGGRGFGPAHRSRPPGGGSLLLSEAGLRLVLLLPPEATPADLMRRLALVVPARPSWDAGRRELWFGAELVKRFRQPAANQELILAVFEEEGWPPLVLDPLPGTPDADPKKRLNVVIAKLNRHHLVRRLRFRGDGTGQGIRWEELS